MDCSSLKSRSSLPALLFMWTLQVLVTKCIYSQRTIVSSHAQLMIYKFRALLFGPPGKLEYGLGQIESVRRGQVGQSCSTPGY
jgi:hypothetical protein